MKRFRDSKYLICEDGKVWSEFTNVYLKPSLTNGYLHVVLIINDCRKTINIHRLVAECYVENTNNYLTVNHKDGNKLNNHYTNLEWCTTKHNTKHAYEMGLAKGKKGKIGSVGDKNGNAILNECEVLEIRKLYVSKKYTYNKLAKKFKVSRSTIDSILNFRTWKHIKEEKCLD